MKWGRVSLADVVAADRSWTYLILTTEVAVEVLEKRRSWEKREGES
jgi:hypothetical protein